MSAKSISEPERKCVGCFGRFGKSELIRLVKPKDGEVALDPSGKSPGRGAYICKSAQCLAKARKKRGLERGLRQKGELPLYIYESLEQEIGL